GVTRQYMSQVLKNTGAPNAETMRAIEQVLRLPNPTAATDVLGSRETRRRPIPKLTRMPGIELAYLDCAIDALREARKGLLSQTLLDSLRKAQGKDDTLFFDASCERVII